MANSGRNSHFLGAKLRALRKQNHMTLEELSQRCIQIDAQAAPSVSYLSMIESGRRVPAEQVMMLLAKVFQRSLAWFSDQNAAVTPVTTAPASGGAARAPLEPAFLFSKELLKAAIPELLAQTGTSGRQFAQLLIRSYQESSRNEFPDLEKAAEEVGKRAFPLSVSDITALCKTHGLELRWFERKPVVTLCQGRELRSMLRSFYEPPGVVYLNKALQAEPARLKFDLATHLAHKVLHHGDGMKSIASGGETGAGLEARGHVAGMDPRDVLNAWRDFECSFFAGALLCPKQPFRRLLTRERYRVEMGAKLELTPAVIMRRMTKVSPYPYWHFFDAYPPGLLRAVYRGNGIPLPWGNMAQASDPCPNWAVFRLLRDSKAKAGSQISVLRDDDRWLLYCCHSLRTQDMAGNRHVLSVGIDLVPALEANGVDASQVVNRIADECQRRGGNAKIPKAEADSISAVANVLNIEWVKESLANGAQIICPRSSRCARDGKCEGVQVTPERDIADMRREILASLKS
ncbi:MAG: MerR family transcriptional regulator [Proteobacteria bacterium]|nr:MerR family transcriptional regulator [Pseudomonadota bacterium]